MLTIGYLNNKQMYVCIYVQRLNCGHACVFGRVVKAVSGGKKGMVWLVC